jgi:acyl carrier protein
MDTEAVEEIILGFLAEDAQCTVEQLRAEMLAGGLEMPVDSVLAVEVLVRVQNSTGVVLPANAETAFALRSVQRFAQAVIRQLGEHQVRPVSA